MKRDLDLLRDQLLQIEALDRGDGADLTLDQSGVDDLVFHEHLRLLKEAGFIEAYELFDAESDGVQYFPTRLTYQGHEYLAAIRDPEVWKATKSIARSVGGAGVAFGWEIAKAEIKRRLSLP